MKENSQLEIIGQNSNSVSQLEQSKQASAKKKKLLLSLMADDLLGVCELSKQLHSDYTSIVCTMYIHTTTYTEA